MVTDAGLHVALHVGMPVGQKLVQETEDVRRQIQILMRLIQLWH